MKIVAVAGTASNVGKTTLACDLLARLPGWEAIKVTKGHYRSCGKDPQSCCVSHLLGDTPLVLSGREKTYVSGKDTGRYWEAGASNVHWVVAAKRQIAEGVAEALTRVSPGARGVVVEGTGFLGSLPVDCAIMVVGPEPHELKASAAGVFPLMRYVFLSGAAPGDARAVEPIKSLLRARGVAWPAPDLLYQNDVEPLAAQLRGE